MGFLDKNVTPAKTYISTQCAWNLPVYFLISSPISLLSICPHFVRTIFGVKLLILLEAKGLKIRVSVVQFDLWLTIILHSQAPSR